MSFWKDKDGNELGFKLWMKKWKKGISNVTKNPTPLEKVNIELNGTFVTLIGLIVCLITLIIFRDKFFVNWFAYGLILIFVGNIMTTGLKFFGLREQKKFLKSLESIDVEEVEIGSLVGRNK